MIRAHFEFKGQNHVSFTVEGHAKSGEWGHDLVCAGVSSVVIGGLSALKFEKRFAIAIGEGQVSLASKQAIDDHDRVVIATILRQLETIAAEHPENLSVKKTIAR